MTPRITVTGSLNMDFVVQVEHLPAPGETVLGGNFETIPGGKGANQACAAGRLGGNVVATRMVGRVGMDSFGDQLRASLSAAGVDVSAVMGTRSAASGVALIWVERGSGQNSIVVAPGANAALSPADVESMRRSYQDARCALFQLETPLPTVEAALSAAREAGALTILDPAPAQTLPVAFFPLIDLLTPNETEACILLGRTPGRVNVEEARELGKQLLALGPRAVVMKLGDQGALYLTAGEAIHSPAFKVIPVDTTAAGDTFNAALAVALAEGRTMAESLRFANAAAALSTTKVGAQSSIPDRQSVQSLSTDR